MHPSEYTHWAQKQRLYGREEGARTLVDEADLGGSEKYRYGLRVPRISTLLNWIFIAGPSLWKLPVTGSTFPIFRGA